MNKVGKALLSFALAAAILVGPCFASELTLDEEDVSAAYTDNVPEEYVSEVYVYNMLRRLFGVRGGEDNPFSDTETASYRFFLDQWCELSQNQFFYKAADGDYVYPLGDVPGFLSESEWSALTADLDAAIPKSIVQNTCSKGSFARFILEPDFCFDFQTAEEYKSFVYLFTPEFIKIIEEEGMDEAIEYWLYPMDDYHTQFMHHEASIIMHELQHEACAKRCGLFYGREYLPGAWRVFWNIYGVMKDICYFDPIKEDFVTLKQIGRYKNHEGYYSESVPSDVKELWGSYFMPGAESYEKGLTGVVQEWASAAVALRMENILVSMNQPYISMMGMADDALFWQAYAMSYLAWVKENDTRMYENFIKDYDTLELIVDLRTFCQAQLDSCKDIMETHSYKVAKEWAESDVAAKEWEEVVSAYQGLREKRENSAWTALQNGMTTFGNAWISGVGQLATCASELLHVA